MARKFYSLLVLFIQVGIAEADIYKCGDVWSTTPCSDAAQPVTDLPDVRGNVTLEKSRDIVTPLRISDFCREIADEGDLLQIRQVSVSREDESLIVEVDVHNENKSNFTGPLFLAVSTADESRMLLVPLASFIPFQASDTFSIALALLGVPEQLGDSLVFRLLYAGQDSCGRRVVKIPDETGGGSDGRARSLSAHQATALLARHSEEYISLYESIPGVSAAPDRFLLHASQFKAQVARQRLAFYCKDFSAAQHRQRCLVLNDKFGNLEAVLHARRTAG